MKKQVLIMGLFASIMACNTVCTAEGPAREKSLQEQGKEPSSTAEIKKLTKEEMLERLNTILKYHKDILASIPDLVEKEGASGAFYEYTGRELVALDEDTLFMVLRTVNSQLSWKNLQRTQRQLKQLKDIENLNRTQKMLKDLQNINKAQRQNRR